MYFCRLPHAIVIVQDELQLGVVTGRVRDDKFITIVLPREIRVLRVPR